MSTVRIISGPQIPAALRDALAGGVAVYARPGDGSARRHASPALTESPVPVEPPAPTESPAVTDQPGLAELPGLTPGTAVIVETSGSTGRPKRVILPREALLASADAFRARYGTFTWTLALPAHYVAGIMVIVRGLCDAGLLDRPLDQPPGKGVRWIDGALRGPAVPLDGLPWNPEGRERHALSIVPTQLVRALDEGVGLDVLRTFDLIVVGGAALPADLRARAEAAGLPLITSYGMSETCGGCVFDGQPLPGVQIRCDADKRIWLQAPHFSGYLDDADATAETLQDGWLRTQDRGEWDAQRLRVVGRVDDVIISGGVNVDLAQVNAHVAERAPAKMLGSVVAVGIPHRRWGMSVVLVADGEARTAPEELAAWKSRLASLAPAAQPKAVVHVPFAQTSTGKLDRQALIRQASQMLGEDF